MTTTEATKPDRGPTLFQIHDSMHALIDRFEDDEDVTVDVEEIAAQLGALEGALEEKVAGCIAYLRGQAALSKALKEEADRLSARAKVHANREKRMKDAIQYVLVSLGRQKVETRLGTVSLANNGGPQPIETLPIMADVVFALDPERRARFVRTTYAWNVDEVRKAIENGDDITVEFGGTKTTIGHVLDRGVHLRVK